MLFSSIKAFQVEKKSDNVIYGFTRGFFVTIWFPSTCRYLNVSVQQQRLSKELNEIFHDCIHQCFHSEFVLVDILRN